MSFNVAVMRPAQQGFFDIAVNFGNIFCSSKVDCCNDDNNDGTCDSDIELLFNGTAGRDSTVVVGFACAAGDASTDTFLYLDPMTIVCDGTTVASITPDGQGNLCDPQTGACVNVTDGLDLLFQVAVFRGEEQIAGVDKAYWNLALGMNTANFPSGQDCYLRFRGTADDDAIDGTQPGQSPGAQDGVIVAGDVYPIVSADVLLSSAAGGPWACTKNPLNGPGSGVTTVYTPPGGTVIPYCYDPENNCPAPSCSCGTQECGVDNCGNACGTCSGTSVCDDSGTCVQCESFTAPFETDPTLDGWVIVDGYPDAGDTHDGSTRWVSPGAEDGFVRLTEEFASERGTMYNTTQTIPAGDASISFDFRITDGGVGGSADGLAFTIVAVAAGHTIDEVTAGTGAGGGIGYENSGVIGTLADAAVTIEIDTYYNSPEAPTPHLAVQRDLDSFPSGTVDQVALPSIVDGTWHTARVDIVGTTMRIYIDGLLQLESTPGNMPSFAGGHMFFSSSTDGAYDTHDIDAVDILGACGASGGGGAPVTAFSDDYQDGTVDPAWQTYGPFGAFDEAGGQSCSGTAGQEADTRSGLLSVDPTQDSYTFTTNVTVSDADGFQVLLAAITDAGDIYYAGTEFSTGNTIDGFVGFQSSAGANQEFARSAGLTMVVGDVYEYSATFTRDAGGGVGSIDVTIVHDPTGTPTTVYSSSVPSVTGTLDLAQVGWIAGRVAGQVCAEDATLTSTP